LRGDFWDWFKVEYRGGGKLLSVRNAILPNKAEDFVSGDEKKREEKKKIAPKDLQKNF